MTPANPLNVYDFFAGGAADERTLAEDCRAFQRIAFRQHVLIGVGGVDASTRVLGGRSAFPWSLVVRS
jgi:isopentenyl diphosphate isomerase/L-lactate dehydrogenase-like FMN-dependent dehydrogenase